MVLQQDQPVVIWGWADKKKSVTVSLADQTGTAVANTKGAWKVTLPALKAGGPYEMTITAGESLVVHDILVGEVWIGSGQSNMEFVMKNTHDAKKEIANAKYPKVHLFTVARSVATSPKDDVTGSWKVCDPESVKDFSAVAYHFGKEIHE